MTPLIRVDQGHLDPQELLDWTASTENEELMDLPVVPELPAQWNPGDLVGVRDALQDSAACLEPQEHQEFREEPVLVAHQEAQEDQEETADQALLAHKADQDCQEVPVDQETLGRMDHVEAKVHQVCQVQLGNVAKLVLPEVQGEMVSQEGPGAQEVQDYRDPVDQWADLEFPVPLAHMQMQVWMQITVLAHAEALLLEENNEIFFDSLMKTTFFGFVFA